MNWKPARTPNTLFRELQQNIKRAEELNRAALQSHRKAEGLWVKSLQAETPDHVERTTKYGMIARRVLSTSTRLETGHTLVSSHWLYQMTIWNNLWRHHQLWRCGRLIDTSSATYLHGLAVNYLGASDINLLGRRGDECRSDMPRQKRRLKREEVPSLLHTTMSPAKII